MSAILETSTQDGIWVDYFRRIGVNSCLSIVSSGSIYGVLTAVGKGGKAIMVNKILSMEEIKKRYDGEWVLIADYKTDDLCRIKRGRVLAHGKNQNKVYRQLGRYKKINLATRYIGEIPKDLTVILIE